jgi:hypothetical protein
MKTLIEMAREADEYADMEWPLRPRGERWQKCRDERFEALVRADEREACAKVCDEESSSLGGVAEGPFVTDFGKHTHMSMAAGAQNCAAAIRARGEAK